jgi:hypothetical protein
MGLSTRLKRVRPIPEHLKYEKYNFLPIQNAPTDKERRISLSVVCSGPQLTSSVAKSRRRTRVSDSQNDRL